VEAKEDLYRSKIARRKPLLMVDVDGVLSVFGFSPHDPPEGSLHFIEGIPHFLSAAAARHLLALVSVFELVWCSGWEEKADEHLPHLLGLPRGLPHLRFERSADRTAGADEARAGEAGAGGAGAGGADPAAGKSLHGHWKLAAIDAYAHGRALAWIDDCIDAACHAWAAARGAPTLLVQTQPTIGLTAADAEALARWARYSSTSTTSGTSSSASSSTKPGSESPAPIFSSDARSASNSWP
jgi:HAD domain in Swiss Army Knife RNA repair proteins